MTDLYQLLRSKYAYLPEDKLNDLLMSGEIILLEPDEVLVRAGEKTTKAALVIEGMMRNYTINDNGEEVTVLFATEMQTITPYATALLGTPATETSAAVERTLIFVMDFHDFKKRTFGDPLFMRLYAELLEASLVAAIQRIEDFTQKKPEQRYQRILEQQAFLIDRAPLKYLASYLGITAVSLSRIRKRVSQNRN